MTPSNPLEFFRRDKCRLCDGPAVLIQAVRIIAMACPKCDLFPRDARARVSRRA